MYSLAPVWQNRVGWLYGKKSQQKGIDIIGRLKQLGGHHFLAWCADRGTTTYGIFLNLM
jgi:hypothetical protein